MNFELLSKETILHEYERIRLRNKRTAQDRAREIRAEYPEIDRLLSENRQAYIALAKRRLQSRTAGDSDREAISRQAHSNTAHIRKLLTEAGYPAGYLDPIFDCPVCQDQAYVDGKPCRCFERRLSDALYRQSNMSAILQQENFDRFDLGYYSPEIPENKRQSVSPRKNAENILKIARDFTESFGKADTRRENLLIYGETGLGKTYLSNCIAKALLDRGHTVLYLSAIDLFEQVLAPYLMNRKPELEQLYTYIYSSELLIIDDLGTETTNSFVCSNLFEIVNQRGIAGKSTIISTNLSMKDMQVRYSERIMSRFVESYTALYLYGENIRYQKRKKEMIQGSSL